MRVIGLDLSLTATGAAYEAGRATWHTKTTGPERLWWLRDRLHRCLDEQTPIDLVALEGYAFGRPNQAHPIGELGGVIRLALYELKMPYAEIPPANVKKYATGKGNATKPDMRMALFQRFEIDERDDNRVDAFWLRAMALDHYGEPLCTMPAVNRGSLDKLTWPDLT